MLLEELLAGVEYRLSGDSLSIGERQVKKIATSPEPGMEHTLYICTKGALENAHDGMTAAYAMGCRLFLCAHDAYPGKGCVLLITPSPDAVAGVLAARLLGFPARRMTVFGIAGLCGKGAVVQLLRQILLQNGCRVAALTSHGVYLQREHTPQTARVPDAVAIQYLLREMADAGTEFAILEFSAYQLAHFAAAGIPFAAVLLTNDSFLSTCGDFDRSLARKRAALPLLLQKESGFQVLPVSMQLHGSGREIRLGEGGDAAVRSCLLHTPVYGAPVLCCELDVLGEKILLNLPTCAGFYAENALSAAVLARIAGVETGQIQKALSHADTTGRMQCLLVAGTRFVYTDCGYLPQHLEAALRAARQVTAGRLSVLLGSVGGRARARRIPLGRVAAEYADHIYLSADDPDTEDPRAICEEMLQGIEEPERAEIIPDRKEAISRAIFDLCPGDVLLLFGKGNADFQLIGGVRTPLNEAKLLTVCEQT